MNLLYRGTKRRIAPCDTHLRMPSRVLFLAPAIKAVSSMMQLKTLRFGCSGGRSGARMRPSSGLGRGGRVLRRIVGGGSECVDEKCTVGLCEGPVAGWVIIRSRVIGASSSAGLGLLGARTIQLLYHGASIVSAPFCRGANACVLRSMARVSKRPTVSLES